LRQKFTLLSIYIVLLHIGLFLVPVTSKAAGPDPCSATPLPSNMLEFILFDLTPGVSSIEDPGCGDFGDNDTWISFVVPPSGTVAIELEAGTVTDAGFALYSGNCSSPVRINCVPNYQCGADPMPKYFYQNLAPGTTLYLRIWSMDGTFGNVRLRIADPFGNPYILTGSATPISFDGRSNCIRLTSAIPTQLGCAWYPEEVDFSEPFTYEFSVYLGNNEAGADGMCIVFQNNGIPTCGISGGGIGAQGIPNSWIVEFDTWQNPEQGDPVADHVAININGVMNHGGYPPVAVPNLENGQFHTAVINWNPVGNVFSVSLNGNVLITMSYDIVANIFGGDPLVNWGVTASTGGAFNEHILCFENIELENASPIFEEQLVEICPGEEVFLENSWQTEPGIYTDMYVSGNGCDSIVTTTLELLPAPMTTVDTVLCSGEILTIAGNTYSEPGEYEILLTSINGCDSLVIIQLEILEFTYFLETPTPFGCLDSDKQISIIVSPTLPGLTYSWTSADGFIQGQTNGNSVTVITPGTYQVNVNYSGANISCPITIESVEVEGDLEEPTILIEQLGEFSCSNNIVALDATSTQGDDFTWVVIEGGDIVSGINSDYLVINGPGVYQLTVYNFSNNCSSTLLYEVTSDDLPNNDVYVFPVEPLNCLRDTTIIDASLSLLEDEFSYQWQTTTGHIVPGDEGSLTPRVTQPGIYWFILEEPTGLCTETYSYEVILDIDTLGINLIRADTLTCARTSADILVSIAGTDPFGVVWTSFSDSEFSIGNNETQLTTSETDTFHLQVTNLINGCTSDLFVEITEDREFPVIEIDPDTTFSCKQNQIALSGLQPITGPYSYQWTALPGGIVGNATGTSIQVNGPGTYRWTVTNTRNGCVEMDSILVQDIRLFPEITPSDIPLITCRDRSLIIDVSVEPLEEDYLLNWSGPVTESEENSITVTIPGTYLIQVTHELSGCSSSMELTVEADTIAPIADAGLGFTLNCQDDEFILDGSNSSTGVDYSYQWTTDSGNILDGAQSQTPRINASGWYYIEVQDIVNGCIAIDSVQILKDDGFPEINVNLSGILNCRDQSVIIDASNSTQGNNIEIFWQTDNGNIVGIQDRLIAEVNQAGLYVIQILNTENQCSSSREVNVDIDIEEPLVITGPNLTLTCDVLSISPQTEGSSDGSIFTYDWNTIDGNILSGSNGLNPIFITPGTYTLTIVNTENYCESQASVVVDIDTVPPLVVLQQPAVLTCAEDAILITASGSSTGDNFQYQWSTINGQISGDPSGVSIQGLRGGTYQLEIINQANGCTLLAQVILEEDRDLPTIAVASLDVLTCITEEVSISSEGSASGPEYLISWSSTSGNISGPTNQSIATATQSGWYQLVIEHTETGCRSIDSVFVIGDYEIPSAVAGNDVQLTCEQSVVTLSGTGDANGRTFSLSWSTVNGQILSEQGAGTILTERAGTYLLTVINLENGCVETDSLRVLPNDDSIDSLYMQSVLPDCFRNTAFFRIDGVSGGQSPYTYELRGWGPSQSQGVFDQVAPGSYELLVTDVNGCTLSQNLLVEPVFPVRADIQPLYMIELGDGVTLEPSYNYPIQSEWQFSWSPDLYLDCSMCPEPYSTPIETTSYTLLVTDENGCTDRVQTLVRVIRKGGIYVPNAFTPGNGDNINDYFTVYTKPGTATVIKLMEVYDRWGTRVFFKENFPPNIDEEGWDGQFKGQLLNPGVYVYRAEIELVNGSTEKVHGELNLFR